MLERSEFIVFVDESGTPATRKPDQSFPIFSLQMVLVQKHAYAHQIVPAFTAFKLRHHGTDSVVLHGRKIDGKEGEFQILQDPSVRKTYIEELSQIIAKCECKLYSAFYLHDDLVAQNSIINHPYGFFMQTLLSDIEKVVSIPGRRVSCRVIVESRKDLDAEMIHAYRGYQQATSQSQVEFELEIIDKARNSIGLQLADLVAKPIARYCLDITNPPKEWSTIKNKVESMRNLTQDLVFRIGEHPLL